MSTPFYTHARVAQRPWPATAPIAAAPCTAGACSPACWRWGSGRCGAAFRAGADRAPIPECKRSSMTKLVSAKTVEGQAGQQYKQMLTQAQSQKALGPTEHPQVKRLRAIANRIIPSPSTATPRRATGSGR